MSFDALTTCNALNLSTRERLLFFVLEAHASDDGEVKVNAGAFLRDLGGMGKNTLYGLLDSLVASRAVYDLEWNDTARKFKCTVASLAIRQPA